MTQPTHSLLADIADLVYEAPQTVHDRLAGFGWQLMATIQQRGTDCFVCTHPSKFSIVAFRGTSAGPKQSYVEAVRDWATNLDAHKIDYSCGQVHAGFHHSVDRIWNELLTAVSYLADEGYSFYGTGHSKGAAEVLDAFLRLRYELPRAQVRQIVTFGCPRLFNPRLASQFDALLPNRQVFRYVHNNDIVARMPLPALGSGWLRSMLLRTLPFLWQLPAGFRHVGQFRYITSSGVVTDDPPTIRLAIDRLRGRWLAGRGFWHDGLDDHSMINYRYALHYRNLNDTLDTLEAV